MAEETEPNKDNESKNEINPNTGGKEKISVFNYILVFLIVISLIVLLYRYYVYSPDRQEEFELKLPTEGIINIHEHIHTGYIADRWLDAMDQCGVSATVMVGSPEATFLLSSKPGFNNYSINNKLILYLEKEHDSKFLAFPTIDPRDPDKLEVLKDQLEQGAIGLKLWAGHTGEIFPEPKETLYDYLGPLNRSDMDEIYEYCEANAIPIIWHMKLYWNYIYNEISDVLQRFPNLIVNIPHFGVLGSDFTRLEQLMDEYPGVYTDISFGGFAYWSMQKMSNNSGVYKSFVENYNDRVMFGTDIVMTRNERKTTQWLVNHTMAYRHMLEKDEFYVNIPNITGEGFDLKGDLNGLGLADEILNKIYFETPLRFLKGEPGVEKTNGSRAGVRNEDDLILIHDEYFDSGFFAYSVMGVAVVVVYNNKLQI